jgi:hypothetical protein
MLALAAAAYRGFASQSESSIARKLDPWLAMLPSLGLGAWKRVWGPETFRIPTSLIDDAMVYVAEEQPAGPGPPRYAVVIRGTNPASLYDWVFGDFWVSQPIAWPAEAPGEAKLSGSTFLGLEIIRRLGGEEDGALPATVAGSARELVRGLERLSLERAFAPPRHFEEKLVALELLRDRITAAARGLFLPSAAEDEEPGTLAAFFARAPAGSRVAVTGHSKGGALALATALWLHEEVAPARGLEVECFSFAGPTAGNGAFVRRYDAALGGSTHRVVNPLDLVPHAWASEDLHQVAGRYEQLAPPIQVLARGVGPLGYAHPQGRPPVLLPAATASGDLHQQIIHQHLDAYLRAAGLPDAVWNTASIFLGRDSPARRPAQLAPPPSR